MEFIDSNSPSFVALAIAIISTVIAALAFRQNTFGEQRRRRQHDAMEAVAVRSYLLLDQLHTLAKAEERGDSEYVLRAFKENAERLEEALDNAIVNGLFPQVASRHQHAWPLFGHLQQELIKIKSLEVGEDHGLSSSEPLYYGLVRTINLCLKFRDRPLKGMILSHGDKLREDHAKSYSYILKAE